MYRICFPFPGDSVGGSHKSALLLIEKLNKKKFEIMIVLHSEGKLSKYLDSKGIRYELLLINPLAGEKPSAFSSIVSIFKSFLVIKNFIQINNIDLVHTNDLRCNLTWSLVSKIYCKHIWHQRTIMSGSYIWNFFGYLTNKIIAISNSVSLSIRPHIEREVIFNPFEKISYNKKLCKSKLKVKLGIEDDKPIVGFIGRLKYDKGIELFSQLAKEMDHINFVAFGDGNLNKLFSKNLTINSFSEPIEPIITGLDIIVCPSHIEGFGRVLVEAMLLETPVVASNISAHLEVSENGKYVTIVANNEAQEYIKLINKIIFHENHDYTKSAKNYAIKKFINNNGILKVEKIYKNLISR